METTAVTIDEIKLKLADVPQEKLTEVYDFIEFILLRSKPKQKKIVKFEGIWKGLGFEKIDDLESEIREIRQKSDQLMSERIHKWNI
jgi:hypothetical protein